MITVCSKADLAVLLPLYAQVQALHAAAYPWRFRADADWNMVLNDMESAHDQGHVFLAAGDVEAPTGFLHFEIQRRPMCALKHAETVGMLHVISVDHSARRRGIGRTLMDEMMMRLRAEDVPRWAVTYWAFNDASKALMANRGCIPMLEWAEAPV